ncbi:MAG TPA: ABC transporter ATP-binding protein, partial [Planctomycetaceae bacterium]|nr:ABC transporter ATP-binding protein [Planctomycetaceae bacterium]
TTLFRLIATLLPLQDGEITLLGSSISSQAARVRHHLGVTFQSPSVDIRLTVAENLVHQGQLYGLQGRHLTETMDRVLTALGLQDRRRELVETLSGGLKRRVEIAKSLLHGPRFLLLDEPSTGLDPGARLDLWEVLTRLQREQGVTVLVTTHLMEEAEKCDRLAILDRSRIVACDSPSRLRQALGGDCLTIRAAAPDDLAKQIEQRFGVTPRVMGDVLRLEHPAALDLLRDVAAAFRDQIASIALSKPTLEDVFIERTGHRFWDDAKETEG